MRQLGTSAPWHQAAEGNRFAGFQMGSPRTRSALVVLRHFISLEWPNQSDVANLHGSWQMLVSFCILGTWHLALGPSALAESPDTGLASRSTPYEYSCYTRTTTCTGSVMLPPPLADNARRSVAPSRAFCMAWSSCPPYQRPVPFPRPRQ